MTLSDDFLRRSDGLLHISPEMENENSLWQMFNTGGVECEVGEFLYGLVRMTKPTKILETGTHKGISAAYMAQALKDNRHGFIDTIEWEMQHVNESRLLITKLELGRHVSIHYMKSEDFKPNGMLDMLFLDTEPQLRFGELLQFYDVVAPGGFILIHDLHQNMNQVNNSEHGFGWPYGPIPQAIKDLVNDDKLRPIHFKNPRGLTMFYKPDYETYRWE